MVSVEIGCQCVSLVAYGDAHRVVAVAHDDHVLGDVSQYDGYRDLFFHRLVEGCNQPEYTADDEEKQEDEELPVHKPEQEVLDGLKAACHRASHVLISLPWCFASVMRSRRRKRTICQR